MIVFAMKQPHLVRHPRSIGTQRVVIALHINDALAVFFVLADHVAEDAALTLAKPFAGGAQFILDASRNENRRSDLRMRVRPLIARGRALVLENGDVFKARIFLQVGDAARPYGKHAFDFLVAELRHASVVMRGLDDDFVRAERTHFVVHAFGETARFTFDAIERIGVRNDADLPCAFARQAQNRGLFVETRTVEWTRCRSLVEIFGLAQHYPTLRDWIAADFHEWWSAGVAARNDCAAKAHNNARSGELRTR